MFFLLYFVFIKLKTENLTAKLQNSNKNCTFSWVNSLINWVLNNLAKELRF